MGLCDGDENVYQIVAWTRDRNHYEHFGYHFWLAQTFPTPALLYLWRCGFIIQRYYPATENIEIAIRAVDFIGRPTGPDLWASASHSTRGTTYDITWASVDLPQDALLPADTYALVIRQPGTVNEFDASCYGRNAAPLYPHGSAWRSSDSGESWLPLTNVDFCFQVWGHEPPESSPDAKVINNWAPLKYHHTPIPNGYQVQVETNIPVHLFMRYSLNPPLKHAVERFRRGLAMPWNTYYCFTSWKENEQEEEGDTLVHTFTKYNWPVCQTRWFYFTASKRMYPTPSASPIFQLHRPEVTFDRYAWSRVFSMYGSIWWMNPENGLAATFQAPDEGAASTHVYLFTQNNDSVVVQVHLYQVDLDDKPTGDPLASTPINLVDGVVIQDFDEHQLVYQHTPTLIAPLEAGRKYAIVTLTVSGSAKWWINFRRITWEGPRDEGEENHVTLHRTRDSGETWEDAYPGRQCYECYGPQP